MGVRYETSDGIGIITIDRPEAMNAMTVAMYREITEHLQALDHDDQVSVGIVTGNGDRAFSAGADLRNHPTGSADGAGWMPWRPDRWDLGMEAAKPLIAAIDGYALAGGLELALICDLRLATPRSQFGAPEVKWNLLHGRGALRLPAVVGLSNAMMLLLSGEFVDAEEALRIGLINRIVDPSELMSETLTLAHQIARLAPDAVRMTKELALRGTECTVEQGLRLYHAYSARLENSDEQGRRKQAFGTTEERAARQP